MTQTLAQDTNPIETWRLSANMTYQDIADVLMMDVSLVWRQLQKDRPGDAFLFRFLRAYGRHTFNALFPELAIK